MEELVPARGGDSGETERQTEREEWDRQLASHPARPMAVLTQIVDSFHFGST